MCATVTRDFSSSCGNWQLSTPFGPHRPGWHRTGGLVNTVADDEAGRLVERLRDATNSHDPDGVAACFTPDYCSETPLHPARSFTGRDQVRRNQEKIFTFVPDLTAEL